MILDEIDKAEPDVPNELIVLLGVGKDQIAFSVLETGDEVTVKRDVLVMGAFEKRVFTIGPRRSCGRAGVV